MRFTSLGSGSSGNGLVVENGTTRVMMDCGFTIGGTKAKLESRGLAPSDISGICVTHEHDDHIGGVARFAKRYGIPVYVTRGTSQWLPVDFPPVLVHCIDSHTAFAIDGIEIEPFPVPHDAREPVQFVFTDGDARLGVLTDLGTTTSHVQEKLTGCHALVIECNHDLDLLMTGPYPLGLKQRVSGRFGHLDNASAGHLVESLDCSKLRHLIAAHLSQQNNKPELAVKALCEAINCEPEWIGVAAQEDGFAWRDV